MKFKVRIAFQTAGSTGEEEISAPTSAFSDGGTEVKSSGGEEHQTAGELEGSKSGRGKHSEELQAKNKDSDQGDSAAADSTVDLQDPLDPPGLFPGQSNRVRAFTSFDLNRRGPICSKISALLRYDCQNVRYIIRTCRFLILF